MNILAIQNIECEPLGSLENALALNGARIEYIRPYRGDSLPLLLEQWEAIIILGGPMAVYDSDKSYVTDEIRLAEAAINDNVPLLGICLGSQIIASAAGAKVFAGTQREVGWSQVRLTDAAATDPLFSGLPTPLPVFQLHGDSFELPAGAEHLASSSVYENQAFRIGDTAYGLQFHVEVTPELVRLWTQEYHDYMAGAGIHKDEILNGLEEKCRMLRPFVDAISRRLITPPG